MFRVRVSCRVRIRFRVRVRCRVRIRFRFRVRDARGRKLD